MARRSTRPTGGRTSGSPCSSIRRWATRSPAGHDAFVEIGAHPVLGPSIAECLTEHNRKGVVLPTLRRGEPDCAMMLGSAGRLFTLGAALDWRAVNRDRATFVKLPTYPWQRERHWHESEKTRRERLGEVAHPLLGMRTVSAEPRWRLDLDLAMLPFLSDHRVQGAAIFPAAGYVEMGLAGCPRALRTDAVRRRGSPSFARRCSCRRRRRRRPKSPCSPRRTPSRWPPKRPDRRRRTGHAGGKVRALPNTARRKPLDHRRHPVALRDGVFRRGVLPPVPWPRARIRRGVSTDSNGCGAAPTKPSPSCVFPGSADNGEAFRLHPTLLDGLFQAMLGTLIDEQGTGLYLPVRIDRIAYDGAPGAHVFGHARLTERNAGEVKGDLVLTDEQGARLVEVRGLTCRAIEAGKETPRSVYQNQWRLKARTEPVPRDPFGRAPAAPERAGAGADRRSRRRSASGGARRVPRRAQSLPARSRRRSHRRGVDRARMGSDP